MSNFSFLLDLQSEVDKKIIFALVNEDEDFAVERNGITYFPTEQDLREFRLGKKNVIWLQELVNKNCKLCHGTGKEGNKTIPVSKTIEEISKVLAEGLREDDFELPQKVTSFLMLPANLVEAVDALVQVMYSQRTDNNIELLAKKYAKIIKADFTIKQPVFCHKCFLPNYKKELELVRRNVRFSIN